MSGAVHSLLHFGGTVFSSSPASGTVQCTQSVTLWWYCIFFKSSVRYCTVYTVCDTLVVLYFLQVQHQVLYSVHSLLHFGGTVLSSNPVPGTVQCTQSSTVRWYCTFLKSSVRYCTHSVTLRWYCTIFRSIARYLTQSASAASVSLYLCPRSLDMGTPRTASNGGNKTYLANQVKIIVLKLSF